MAHAQKPDFVFRVKRTSPFKSAGGRQFSRLLAAELCAISGSNAGYTMFRGSVKGTGYPFHSPVSPLHFPCSASPRAITFPLDSTKQFSTTRKIPVSGSFLKRKLQLRGKPDWLNVLAGGRVTSFMLTKYDVAVA